MKIKIFLISVINLLIIIGAFGLYQAAALHKADADKIVSLEKKIEQLQSGKGSKAKGGKSGGSTYKDGSYEGSAKGFGGNVVVKVTVKNDKIEKIDLVDASKEDGSYLASAKGVIKSILDKQSTDVDTVSGATFTSTGIINAVISALEKAAK
ncbi:FMN-binding domain protein [Eubacterium nodatum ATCC 33099]|nr:FMN-binding domain protein [Eubacterium nodatum ATCC 33099]